MAKMIADDMDTLKVPGPGTFTFSCVRPDNLGATEYTLVSIVLDTSGSVEPFANDLLKTVKSVIDACKKSPRAENLLVRLVSFNNNVSELHGFMRLNDINPDDYDTFETYGMTALFDATYSAVGSTLEYARTLMDQEFDVNGAVYIITDGMDNNSTVTTSAIAKKMTAARAGEEIESLITILVGLHDPNIDWEADVSEALTQFKDKAGLTQYVELGKATAQRLAKLAAFVSESISSQSKALGSGAASQPLTF